MTDKSTEILITNEPESKIVQSKTTITGLTGDCAVYNGIHDMTYIKGGKK